LRYRCRPRTRRPVGRPRSRRLTPCSAAERRPSSVRLNRMGILYYGPWYRVLAPVPADDRRPTWIHHRDPLTARQPGAFSVPSRPGRLVDWRRRVSRRAASTWVRASVRTKVSSSRGVQWWRRALAPAWPVRQRSSCTARSRTGVTRARRSPIGTGMGGRLGRQGQAGHVVLGGAEPVGQIVPCRGGGQ
jgi:hypothetical protein